MRYFVLTDEGEREGPFDVATLIREIADHRIRPSILLQPEEGGDPLAAWDVLGPVWPKFKVPPPTTERYGILGPVTSISDSTLLYAPKETLPEEVRREWNWGALAFPWIWGPCHGVYATLFCFVPVALHAFATYQGTTEDNYFPGPAIIFLWTIRGMALFVCLASGRYGNQLAWESGRFRTVAEMDSCQFVWAKWAWGLAAVAAALLVLRFFLPTR